jgi:hypothetical protein
LGDEKDEDKEIKKDKGLMNFQEINKKKNISELELLEFFP